ncbi:hypothetical protein K353_06389 [Kitasatospora sp. SolWspMP-SS2h]|uniref:hypothetical protein n=1 Tax=Kitasatospora sp. SolWspMP-SS2h TaxID=1305729 RepID=UPI000DB94D43|nr:hypothetical protein [Kitasatospora sp. SolWspMP-SS2h]RAJ30395.1 hypothetical protein K353_06389 [Kitasatospora sp. SolWspMP-SS2h]
MADETTITVPEAEQTPAPVEHTADAADPNAIEHALEVLAEGQPAAPAVEQIRTGDDETFEPLGSVTNCP